MKLFPEDQKVGVFRGFREGGLEFHADIALPYNATMHQKPMHGSFIYREKNNASTTDVGRLLNLQMPNQEVEAIAARSNMTTVVALLHDPSSQMLDRLLEALSAGKLCVVDISQMRGQQGYILAGIILRQIFSRNQEEFTKQNPQTIPTIAVIEEAQSVLNDRSASSEPFVSWVKEGRKYDLGAVLITQQPGAIANELRPRHYQSSCEAAWL